MEPQVFTVKPELAGQTAKDLTRKFGGDPGTLARFLGIGENTPLTAGQVLRTQNVQGFDPSGSREVALLPEIFGAGTSVTAFEQQQARTAREQAIAPAVSSLRAGIPETQQRFDIERQRLESEKDPLTARYDALIADITRIEEKQIGNIDLETGREFGRRGISGGLLEQTLNERRDPIFEASRGATVQAGIGRDEGFRQIQNLLSSLTGQETGAVRDIRNAIAQLQAQSGGAAISDAFAQRQLAQGQTQFEQTLAENRRQFDISQEPEDVLSQLLLVGQGASLFDPATRQEIFNNPKTFSPGGGGGGIGQNVQDLRKQFGGQG